MLWLLVLVTTASGESEAQLRLTKTYLQYYQPSLKTSLNGLAEIATENQICHKLDYLKITEELAADKSRKVLF